MILDENEKDSIELTSVEGLASQKKEGVDKRLSEMIDISFALTIDVQVILSRRRWMIRNSKKKTNEDRDDELDNVKTDEQSHDEVYSCLKGGSGNSRGKILAISMVEEAWLSEKEEV
ncbi:hypothetical protein Tco_0746511 [Tanacetum coccineum]